MPQVSARWVLALAGVVVYAAAALFFGGDARAEKSAGQATAAATLPRQAKDKKPTPMFYGVRTCSGAGCHTTPPKQEDWPAGDLLCRGTEFELWNTNDKHADAYNVLTKARGQQMAKILGYDVTKAKACLVCHASYIEDETLLKESQKNKFDVKEGVNCVVCHGAAVEWVDRHSGRIAAQKWRPLSREQKETEGGMRNLWDPIKRAELCVSCHVGNLNEGKFVTHEMYAAGHPPLPGFEAAMFSEEMPRHWEYLREKKSEKVRKELGYKEGEQEQTRLLLVGSAVALRESMRLLEAQARACQKAKDDDHKALDLANFDCYACHHDLKPSAWRPKRGYAGKPGRVPMREWPTELVKLGIIQSVGAEATPKALALFAAGRQNLREAFVARPYGDLAKIEKVAADLGKWADELARALNKPIYEKDVKALLSQLPKQYGEATLDYDSARQVGWAFDVMYNERHGYPYPRKGVPPTKDTGAKSVRSAQKDLAGYLRLRLPKGRDKIIEDELADNLKALNDYDPAAFRKKFATLTEALGNARPSK